MIHIDRTNSGGTAGGAYSQPGHALYEIPRGRAMPVISAAGFVRQFDSGDNQTVLVELVALSAAYNLVKAL